MKKNKKKIIYTIKYITDILAWSFFVIIVLFIGLLGYYYCALKVYEEKGYEYAPAFSIYTIVSPSMVPTINVYDMIVNLKVDSPTDIVIGDIITFNSTASISKGVTITHRVNNTQLINGEYQYVTKGDNNSSVDPVPTTYENIIGKTYFRLPGLGKVQKFINSSYGFLFIILVPATLIIINDIYKIIKYKNVKKVSRKYNTRKA